MVNIIKSRKIIDDFIIQALAQQDVATIHESMGKRGAMTYNIKPIAHGSRMCGRALTVKCHPGDNLMLIKAISIAKAGDVIVADMGHIVENGPFGEVLAVECKAKGVAGLVINCTARDSMAIEELGFPVFSAGLSVFGTAKATLGTINHPIVCGGVQVNPGDIILGDNDGVAVIPYDEAETVLNAANKRRENEAAIMERLRQGESLFDIYNYQKVFDAIGCTEEE